MSNNVFRKILVFTVFVLFLAIFSESVSAAITACGSVGTSDSLTQNISSADTCLIVTANNVNINCNGFSITFNTGIAAGTSFGVYAPGFNNITVRNCVLIDGNGSNALKGGIYFDSVNLSNITNNTIRTFGKGNVLSIRVLGSNSTVQDNTLNASTLNTIDGNFSNGIVLTQGSGFAVLRNTIFANGQGGPSSIMANFTSGCYIDQNSINNTVGGISIDLRDTNSCTVSNNTINISGSSNGISAQYANNGSSFINITRNSVTVFNSGVSSIISFSNSSINISFNNVTVLNGSNADGIRTGTNGTFIYRNNILFDGVNSGSAIPIDLGSTFSSVVENNITYQNASNCNQLGVLYMSGINNALIQGNNMTIRCSTLSRISGIYLSANNNATFINNRINISTSNVNWLRTATATTNTTFTNTTFANTNGEAFFYNFGNTSSSYVNMTFFNFTNSSIFINTTNLTYLNTSAQISIFNPVQPISPPKLAVDFNDNGNFVACSTCTILTSTPSLLIFNVTRFTTYSSSSIFPASVNESSNLTSNITVNGTAINIMASNIVFDCLGNTIFFDNLGSGEAYGINISGYNNVTIRNCRVFDNTAAGDNNRGISIVTSVGSNISNVTVFTSTGTSGTAHSIYLSAAHNGSVSNSVAGMNSTSATPQGFTLQAVNSRNNTISGNTLYLNVSSIASSSFVADFITTASNNFFENNSVFSNVSVTHYAVSLQSQNTTVRYNNITVFQRDAVTTAGISIAQHNQTIYGNIITVNTSSTPTMYGIDVGTSNDSTIYNNIINIRGDTGTTTGVNLGSNSRQTSISSNNISSVCPSSTICSAIDVGNSVNTTVQHNIVNATSGTVFVIDINAANNAVINNNTIFGNASAANSQGIRYLTSSATQGVRIINNNVTMISSDTLPYGIRLSAANLNNDCYLANNSVNVTGSLSTARGISTDNIQNVTIYNSTIYVSGTSTVYGIYSDSTNSNITVNIAYIENNATDSASYALVDNDNSTWSNITIFKRANTARWLTRAGTATSNLSAITFANSNGSIKLNNFLANYTITNDMLNITYNLSRVNSSTSSLNTTGQITLHNVNTSATAVDFDDNGTFADCSSPQCVLESFNGSTIVFNVSSFTSYSAMNLSGGGVSCGSTLTSSTTLTENLTCPGTAFIIGANNVELDCNGYTISYGNNGSDSQVGVNVTGFSGVAIRNCILVDGNASGSDGYGIRFTTVNNSVITNNTITTNGTTNNYGIRVNGSVTNVNNSITNNRVNSRGTTTGNTGIYAERSYILNVSQNNVSTNGTTGNDGISLYIVTNASVNDNIISANGTTSSVYGFYIYSTANMTFYRNNVSTIGTGASFIGTTDSIIENNTINVSATGVYFETSSRNKLSKNNIISSSDYGVSYAGLGGFGNNLADSNVINCSSGISYIATQPDSNFTNNNVTVTNGHGININSNSPTIYLDNNIFIITPPVGGPNYGVDIGATNNSIINNLNLTILGNTAWMRTTLAGRTTNFTNTTLRNNNGSVFYLGTFQLENQSAVERSSLNISENLVRVNSSAVPFLNRSAQIILNNVNTSTLLVDFEDDGTYGICGASQCQLESFNGSTVVFNVSSFTSYSTSSGGVNVTLTKTDNPNPVPNGSYLSYTVTFNVTGGVAYNITINETYPNNVTFVNATPNATSGNNSWNAGNLTASQSYQINITVLVDSGLTGGTVLTNTINATYENSSGTQFLINVSENTTVSVPLDPPVLTNVSLFATSIQNLTSDNLTVAFNLTSPGSMNPAWNITDWRMNASSIVFFQYPFENNVSNITTSLRDYSTSNISATLGNGDSSATPNWTTSGQVGAAYDFDGTNDQINISDTTDPTEFSLEVWVKPDVVSSKSIFLRTDASGPGTSWSHQLRLTAGSAFEAYVFDGGLKTVTGNSTVAAGSWYHVVMTAEDGGNLALYVNGSQEGTNASVSTLWTGGNQYRVGSNSGGGFGFFDGIIDEVRLYNRTLTQSEIALLYNEGLAGRQPTTLHSSETEVGETWSVAVTPNNHDYEGNTTLTNNLTIRTTQAPVISNVVLNASTVLNTTSDNLTAYFNVTDADGDATTNITNWLVNGTSVMVLNLAFEGGSNASSSKDYSNFSNNITGNAGDPEFLPSGNAVGFGAYDFDGVDDLLTAPHNDSLNLVNGVPMSWESFIFYNSSCSDNYPVIVAKSNTVSTSNYHLEITKGSDLFGLTWYNGGYVTHASTVAVPSGYWTHLAVVYNGSHLLNYRNGTFDNAVAQGSAPVTNTELLRVGNRAGDNDFCGKIDYVRIWNRSLSGSQIAALYNYQTNLIVSNETSAGDTWQACVTPNDKTQDGNTNCSNVLTINSDAANATVVSLTKTDSPDPLNLSSTTLLNYVINFTVLNGTAYNITINETYPSNTTFVNASPTPTTGNTSWDAGNITTGTTYLINIMVNVSSSLSNGTILTNTVNTTYANSTGTQLLINVSENTTVLNVVGLACGDTISSSTVLTQNYSCPGTAFIIGANNVELDCNGYTVVYSNNVTNSQYGVLVDNRTNTTIRNCRLIKGNSAGSNTYGITMANNNNSLFTNNTILTNGSTSVYGLYLSNSQNNSVYSNNITTNGSGGFSYGMLITSSSNNNRIINNSITTKGASATNRGIATVTSSYNTFQGNNITAGGTDQADGIYLASSNSHNIISFNNIVSNGSGTGAFAIFAATSPTNNTIANNSVTLNSGSGYLLYLANGPYNNRIENNNFTSVSMQGVGITLSGAYNNNFTNNRINLSNSSNYEYISFANSSVNSTNNDLINTTFVRNNVTASFRDFHVRIASLNASTVSADPSGLINISKYLNVSNVSGSSWIMLNLSYTDADVTTRNIIESSLRIWKYNQTSWTNSGFYNSGEYGVDTSNNYVYANITSFSDFGVLGETFSNVSVSLTKTDSPDPLNLSSTTILTYQVNFTVTNGTAYNVTINETYPSNTTFVNATPSPTTGNTSWNAGNITIGSTYQINITVNVSSSLSNGTILTNTVNATLENSTGSSFQINVSENTTVLNVVNVQTNATLTKTDSPDPLNISNTTLLTYQINFTVTQGTAYNTTINETYSGNVTFVNATPSPTSGNNSWNVGNITSPSTYQINITVNVSSSLANGSIVANDVNATYENATGSTFSINASASTTIIADAAQPNATIVSLTKTDSADPLNISSTTLLTYQINFTVTNGTAINTTINETYPSNTTFINATPTPTTGNTSWNAGNISAGTTYQINITLNVSNTLTNGTILTNTVNTTYENATGSTLTANVQENTTIIRNLEFNTTIVTLTKTDSADPLNISSTTLLTYQINFTVTNGTAFNTTINETYPANTTFINASPAPTTGNNSWNAGNITAGNTYQINITLNVSSLLPNGTILTNTVNTTYENATGSTLTTNVQENTTITKNLEFNATVISMTKTDAPDPVVAGQDLTYTININVTNGTAYNITLSDSYPSEVSFVSASPSANASNNTWIVGNLTAGQSFQVNITVNVNSGTANGTTINNTANISYANATGNILTLNATAQTTVSTQSFPIVINNNTNITTNGTTTGPGIIINASNVTVDCNNNIITGSGIDVGVNLTGFNNVTIQNCVFVNFATGAYVENSDDNRFTNDVFRTVTNGVNLLGTSQNSVFNRTVIAASSDWVFASAASSGNSFQNTSYNDTGGQIVIVPSVTHSAGSNVSQATLDITSPEAFIDSSTLPFLDAASTVTITGITNTATALILGDFDDDGVYQICDAPFCSLISFASGTAVFNASGWTTYTVVDSGVNFTLTKTSSPDPVTPGNNVVFTITATVNSGFAQNITVVESPPAELTFVTSTPTNISDNTWLLNNLSAGQSAQINVTYAVNSSFTGTIQNNVSVTFQNSTNGTISANVSENTTAQFPSPSGGSGGGGGGSGGIICPPLCKYPENANLPVCRNNCPAAQVPAPQDFGNMFPPISESAPIVEEPVIEEPVVEEPAVVEPVKEEVAAQVKSKFFPWWYILIAIIVIVFMIWETHHILKNMHKPKQPRLDKVDKDIARMKKMLKKR